MSRFFLVLCIVAACDCDGGTTAESCVAASDCASGVCIDGRCVSSDAGDLADSANEMDADDESDAAEVTCDSGISCGGECCRAGERCAAEQCVPELGPCESNDDCAGDSYCDASGQCTPYGVPPNVINDPECQRPIEIGSFLPTEQCRWPGEESVEMPSWVNVYSAPMVADFNLDDDPAVLAPSIVFSSFDSATNGGISRVVDGRTCETQFSLTETEDRLVYASNFAIGDLDGDGRPEIVAASLRAPSSAGGLVAFGYDAETESLQRLWFGRDCSMPAQPRHMPNDWHNNNGPSMHDVDDDGVPEVLFDRFVYDADGCLLNPSQPYTNYLLLGLFSVVADVDVDGEPELVTHDGVFAWNTTMQDWVLEPYWAPPAEDATEAVRVGHVAVANMGYFPGAVAGDPDVPDGPDRAEIVVVSAPSSSSSPTETGTVRVMSIGGDIVFGPYPLPAQSGQVAGRGGPPTVGDFDGDGRREVGVAGGSRYTVFDVDCDADDVPTERCMAQAGAPRGVLWSRQSQDLSSNVTGSSVFDFDADGVAEVVYGDECFVRIYRGTDGEVLFSQSASSGTGYEMPIIADVDGDFNSEIVVAMTSGVSCPATDPIFDGTSTFSSSQGIMVLRDELDRWAASRPIWNQHAYAVTNVNDDGTIPRTSERELNHGDETLNNFRMNAQGTLELRGAADLTVALARVDDLCGAESGAVTLFANVCNRGTNPVPDGARVVFYDGDPDADAPIACETVLPNLLQVGNCAGVSCDWTIPDDMDATEVTVVVDPDAMVFECRDGNNRGVIPASSCGPI